MSRRRGRHLNEEEEALWGAVKRTVVPLRTHVPMEAPAPEVTPAKPEKPAARRPVALAPYTPPGPPPKPAVPVLHPLGRRDRQQVVRGRRDIDGRLDLHGYRQDEAHARLAGFLGHAQAMSWSLVLVITGKGMGGSGFAELHEPERGVLRRVVPLWLSLPEFRRFVLGFEDAHLVHGGGGALYVRIRKRKAP
ncbi:Smr/MutS family protein [Oryzibacter oryziterrae]|uniref:Smr/MutS family protein n=1 Tax=Oryzibacter oryziterrae TaxID=2766474 RepID=UPI001F1BD4D4|nr:Smr/MutS family protein [Oryzibacter oryziterrae]